MEDNQTNGLPKIAISKVVLNSPLMLLAFSAAIGVSVIVGVVLLVLYQETIVGRMDPLLLRDVALACGQWLSCMWGGYAVLVVFRVRTLSRLFVEGIRVTATIIDVTIPRSGAYCYVKYEYDWRGMCYTKCQALTDARIARGLLSSDSIELVVDATCPTRAIIRRLYLAE